MCRDGSTVLDSERDGGGRGGAATEGSAAWRASCIHPERWLGLPACLPSHYSHAHNHSLDAPRAWSELHGAISAWCMVSGVGCGRGWARSLSLSPSPVIHLINITINNNNVIIFWPCRSAGSIGTGTDRNAQHTLTRTHTRQPQCSQQQSVYPRKASSYPPLGESSRPPRR